MLRKIIDNIKNGMIWEVSLNTYPFVYAYLGVCLVSVDRTVGWRSINLSLDID